MSRAALDPRPAPAEPLPRLVLSTALTATAAIGLSSLFAGLQHLPALLAAVLCPAILTGLLAFSAPRVPSPLRTVIAIGGAAVVAVLAAHPGTELIDGPMQVLTGALPLDATGPPFAAVLLAAGVAAAAAAELAIRARSPLTCAAPAVLCLVVALAAGASGRPVPSMLGVLLVAGVGALLAVAGTPRAGPSPRGRAGPRLAGAAAAGRKSILPRAAAVVVMVAVAAPLAGALGPSLPGSTARGRRFDARDLVVQPVVPRTSISPLADFPGLRAEGSRVLFSLRADRPVERLRLATVTTFDGHLWSSGGPYLRAGRALPPRPPVQAAIRRTRLDVTLGDPANTPWLPVPGTSGRAVRVSVGGLGVDSATGDLIVPAGRADVGSYEVLAEELVLDPAGLRNGAAAAYDGPPPPGQLPAQVQARTAKAVTSFGQLAVLDSYFHTNGGFSRNDADDAPGGHGIQQIGQLLASARGTPEQYASAFSVMARYLGYDARVVVGFKLPRPAVPGELVRVTAAEVYAWSEVRFNRLGWVPFDPTPRNERAAKTPPGSAADTADQVEKAAEQELATPRTAVEKSGPAPAAPATGRGAGAAWRLATTVAALLLSAVLALVLVVPLVKTARRRRRRREPDPARRIVGAWDETIDRCVEHGVRYAPTMTVGEVVDACVDQCGTRRTAGLRDLAGLVDAACFAKALAGPGQAAAAWALSERLRRSLTGRVPAHQRLRHAFDPQPLLRKAGSARW